MKVQLDHKVVRDIIANDPEFEVEVRQAILRSAMKKGTEKLLCDDDKSLVSSMITEALGEHGRPDSWYWTPPESFKEKVRKEIDDKVSEAIYKAIDEKLPFIEDKVEELLVKYISSNLLESAAKILESKLVVKTSNVDVSIAAASSQILKKLRAEGVKV